MLNLTFQKTLTSQISVKSSTPLLIKPYFPIPTKFTGGEKTKLRPVDEKENRYEVERVMEYRSQPRTELPQYMVRWKGYDYH